MLDYATIRGRIENPQRRTLTWDAQRELLHAHAAEPDVVWPAPKNWREARNTMQRLPHHTRVLCAYIAAEMVLPRWEQWAAGRTDADAPRNALLMVRRWLDGENVGWLELRDAADAADAAAANANAYAYADAAYAAYAAAADYARREFYSRWWNRCRARLAIADIANQPPQ